MRPPANVLVRRARPADAAALKAILRDTFETTWRPNITAAAAQAVIAEDRPAGYVAQHGLDSGSPIRTARWSAWSTGRMTSCTRCTSAPATLAAAWARA